MPGQINLDTQFGKQLKALAENPAYQYYCEVGTWNGEGSTLCLAEGFKERKDRPVLISVEANVEMWGMAKKFWEPREKNFQLYLLNGRLGDRMLSEQDITHHILFERIRDHYRIHYLNDVIDFRMAKKLHIEKCDVALLDGGEFASQGDWEALRKLNPKIVALDDIDVMKNNGIYCELLCQGWETLFVTRERNGAAILKNPEA